MTLTELRYVVTLAQCQHFGQAAEVCNVSQPTLSIAVKKLESELGVDLFERSQKNVRATPVGEQVIRQSQRVLEEASSIKDIAKSGMNQLNTPLHIGAIFTIGPYLFPHFIKPLQKNAPDMHLVIEEGYTSGLRKRLRNGEVDVILVSLPFNEPDVVVQPLYEEEFVVLLPKLHPLSRKDAIAKHDLDNENVLMMGEGHCFRDQVFQILPNINKNKSGLFLGVVFVSLLFAILSLSIWVSQLSKTSQNVNSKFESRLTILEEQLQLADSTSTEFLTDINTQLQFLDKEIRKLWDLSNKRNKVNITKLTKEIDKHSTALKQIALTQTNDQKNIINIKNQSQKLSDSVVELSQLSQNNLEVQNKIDELSKSFLLLEETVQAFDSYRRQNNEMLQEMQLEISSINMSNTP